MVIAALPMRARYRTRLIGLVTCLWLVRWKPTAPVSISSSFALKRGTGAWAGVAMRRFFVEAYKLLGGLDALRHFLPLRGLCRFGSGHLIELAANAGFVVRVDLLEVRKLRSAISCGMPHMASATLRKSRAFWPASNRLNSAATRL
jgi:hypothetical protein